MGTIYQVTAPLVTLRVLDANNAWVNIGYYRDASVPGERIDPASLQHHLDNDMIALVSEPVGAVADFEPPAGPGGRPAGNASRDVWAAYAGGQGAPEDETKPVDEGGLSRDDLRAKYGS